MAITPHERSLRASAGAYAAFAKHGRDHMTKAARAANPSSDEYWLAQTDPALSERERSTRAQDAKRSYFKRLAMKSAQARKRAS